MRRVAAATAVVMAMAGVTSFGAGVAFADSGPGGATVTGGSATGSDLIQDNSAQEGRLNSFCGQLSNADLSPEGVRMRGRCLNHDGSVNAFAHTRSKGAHVEGGSGAATEFFQQNIAQKGRLNNACADQNDFMPDTLEGSRLDSDCRNKDRSLNKHTLVTSGGARVEGGSAATGVEQQNIAQEGRLNNACANTSDLDPTIEGSRLDSDCRNHDRSFSKKVLVKGGGARIEGGSSSTSRVEQQNIAQEGRLNNACANFEDSDFSVNPGRVDTDCRNKDGSFSKKVLVKGGGARIEGGSSTDASVQQQNIAQEGRQNNACTNHEDSTFDLTDGRVDSKCGNKDGSFSKKVRVKSGGARIEGGSSTSTVGEQNVAQEGRQNNACVDGRSADFSVDPGRLDSDCGNKDGSFSKKVLVKSGGARIEGGSTTESEVQQQNIAQEGRQNNACVNFEDSDFTLTDGRVDSKCGNKDGSFSKKVRVKSGGARIEGGSSTAGVAQQNFAQEGRQNNACLNGTDFDFTLTGSRLDSRCGNKDGSFNKHVLVKDGGARVEGGPGTDVDVFQYNVAQEGRQNNHCANFNEPVTFDVDSGRVDTRCSNKDGSFNKHVLVKGGGARVEGGSGAGSEMFQYNVAQEGRQNNACANLNGGDITLTDSRADNRCKTLDESTNVGTKESDGGALAEGGSSTDDLFQQNTAQTGRQSNHCSNPNNLTATGSRAQSHCTAADRSTNIATINR
ncbi:hypothetical protein [Streptomyces sp. NPDC051776]|uniref:hypothetical protein n=1 Tax=Streptomyces sp. NPDC051776 TaxID=3155414 RepID=UPI003431F839